MHDKLTYSVEILKPSMLESRVGGSMYFYTFVANWWKSEN